tara:strand:- start:1483 stop:2709 length:1227 start_codon:yes stop_codon:yes gene_type:complete
MKSAELLHLSFGSFLVGLSLFCANLLFVQKEHRQVYWPLGLFFLSEGISSLTLVLDAVANVYDIREISRYYMPLSMPFAMAQVPLFWMYVRGLTADASHLDIRYKGWHAAPALGAFVFMFLFLMLPNDVYQALERSETVDHPLVPVLIFGSWALTILFYIQIFIYLFLTVRLLTSYNTRLKDLFASTEDRELHWLWWIVAATAAFLIFNIANALAALSGIYVLPTRLLEQPVIDLTLSAGTIWILALWGLRQKPGLACLPASAEAPELKAAEATPKYERSALSNEQARRLARKINSAMENDHLYRNPNLSLWDLSKHIGVTSNYLSQTLNETIGSTFFDYVNRWRIEEAASRVQDSKDTILTIAYDVGFNSKSSFYSAFKKHLGVTPSALRHSAAPENTRPHRHVGTR